MNIERKQDIEKRSLDEKDQDRPARPWNSLNRCIQTDQDARGCYGADSRRALGD